MRFRALLLSSALVGLSLTACEDPSNVGLGLVGGEGGEPVVVTLGPTTFENAPVEDVSSDTARVLAGMAADPLLGDVRSTGYVDFGTPVTTDGFKNGTVTSAVLMLRPAYVYGDTTSVVRLQLSRMTSAWDGDGAPTDTVLAIGAPVTEFSFSPTDTLVRVELPAAWVSEHDALLRSDNFTADFHGFAFSPVSGNAVVGFNPLRSGLRVHAGADSASYGMSRTFSSAARTSDPALPAGRLAMQDNAGPGLRLTFDLDQDGLRQTGLNRAVVRFYADTLLLKTNDAFIRPPIRQLDLYGITAAGDQIGLERTTMDSTGAFTFRSTALRVEMQEALLGKQTFDRFELRVPRGLGTLNAVAFYSDPTGEKAPAALFTVTRVEQD